jgi:hypothetical protein
MPLLGLLFNFFFADRFAVDKRRDFSEYVPDTITI